METNRNVQTGEHDSHGRALDQNSTSRSAGAKPAPQQGRVWSRTSCPTTAAVIILGNQKLNAVEDERDLGVIVDKSLKSSRQYAKAAAAANAVLGMIRRTFFCKDKELISQLYKSLVRPRLEYCIQVWRPYLKKDINVLKRVQKEPQN